MKPVRKICCVMWAGSWLGDLVLVIRNKETCKCDGWSPDTGCALCRAPWCRGLTPARKEQSGKAVLQHCRSMGRWCRQGKPPPRASITSLYCRYLCRGVGHSGESPTVSIPVYALFCWWKRTACLSPKWGNDTCWYHMNLHVPFRCNSAAIMNTRGGDLRQLFECFTLSSTYVAK